MLEEFYLSESFHDFRVAPFVDENFCFFVVQKSEVVLRSWEF